MKIKKILGSIIVASGLVLTSCGVKNENSTQPSVTLQEKKLSASDIRNAINNNSINDYVGQRVEISGKVYALKEDIAYIVNGDVAFQIYFKNAQNSNLVSVGKNIEIKGDVISSAYDDLLYVDALQISELAKSTQVTVLSTLSGEDDLKAHRNALYKLQNVSVVYKKDTTINSLIGIKCGNTTIGIIFNISSDGYDSSINVGDNVDISFISIISPTKLEGVDVGIYGFDTATVTKLK